MEKSKLAEFGERLKTGGAKFGRVVSGKLKEIFETPTLESKMVDEATTESLNWGMNLRICTMINSEELNGSEIARAIKKKLLGTSVVSQKLSLDLLEDCTLNCETMSSKVASEKVLDEMVRLIDNPETDNENRLKAMQLIRAWGESEDLAYLPAFRQTYMSLRERGISPLVQEGNLAAGLESHIQQPLSPPERYPLPDVGLHNADRSAIPFSYQSLSVEEKKEFLAITRNSVELLTSILNSEIEPKPLKEDLTLSMLEKCKESQPVIKGIIERTTDDEGMLCEALYLHDELQQIISKYEELEASQKSAIQQGAENPDSTKHEGSDSEVVNKPGETVPQRMEFEDVQVHSGGKQRENSEEVSSSSQLGSQKDTKIVDSQRGGSSGCSSEKEGE